MPAYSDMKDSGVKWIGQVPVHWRLSRVKNSYRVTLGKMLTPNNERPEQTLENYLCAANIKWSGVDTSLQKQMWFSQQDKETYRLCSGDVLISEGGLAGTSCIYDGELNPCYIQNSVHCCRSKGQDLSKFLYYWMYAVCCSGYVDAVCNRATIQHYTKEKVIMTPVVMPPVGEQLLIVAYLDRVCADIDTAVAEAKASIEDYKLLRQSVITQAVTKGLDPNAPMKDSGVEWVGEIPLTWNRGDLKALFSFGKGLPITKADLTEDGVFVVSYGQIHAKTNTGTCLDDSLLRYVAPSYLDTNAGSLIRNGDIVFADTSEDLDGMGNAVLMDRHDTVFAGYHTIVARPNDNSVSTYLAYLFRSDPWRSQLRSRATGIKVFSVTQRMLRSCTVILPPESDRSAIVAYLNSVCARIDDLVSEKQSVVAELESYKKSLIYEVVTGKRRVA